MSSLRKRLLTAEGDFLIALGSGEHALCAFETRWEKLLQDIDDMAECSGLDDETATLTHTIASRIATLAEASSSLLTSYESITAQLMDQVDILMAELTISENDAVLSHECFPSTTPSHSKRSVNSSRKRRRESTPNDMPHAKRTRSLTPYTSFIGDSTVSRTPIDPSSPERPFPSTQASTQALPQDASNDVSTQRYKRRFSDSGTSLSIHQHKRIHLGPRLHAVSDSFIRPPCPSPSPMFMVPSNMNIPFDSATLELLPLLQDTHATGLNVDSLTDFDTPGSRLFLDSFSDDVGRCDALPQSPQIYQVDHPLQSFLTPATITTTDTLSTHQTSPCATTRSSPSSSPGPSTPESFAYDWPLDILTSLFHQHFADEPCVEPGLDTSARTVPAQLADVVPPSFHNVGYEASAPLFDSAEELEAFDSDWYSLLNCYEPLIKFTSSSCNPTSPLNPGSTVAHSSSCTSSA